MHAQQTNADLPRSADGRLYHLGIRHGELANRIVRPFPCPPYFLLWAFTTHQTMLMLTWADHRRRPSTSRAARALLRRNASIDFARGIKLEGDTAACAIGQRLSHAHRPISILSDLHHRHRPSHSPGHRKGKLMGSRGWGWPWRISW